MVLVYYVDVVVFVVQDFVWVVCVVVQCYNGVFESFVGVIIGLGDMSYGYFLMLFMGNVRLFIVGLQGVFWLVVGLFSLCLVLGFIYVVR